MNQRCHNRREHPKKGEHDTGGVHDDCAPEVKYYHAVAALTDRKDLANLLADYCHVESAKRPEIASKIEKAAQDLLRSVSRNGRAKHD